MRILICDDDILSREQLKKYIQPELFTEQYLN